MWFAEYFIHFFFLQKDESADGKKKVAQIKFKVGMKICVKKKGDVFNNFYGEIARLNFPKKFKHEIRLQTGQLKSYHRKFLDMEEMSVR